MTIRERIFQIMKEKQMTQKEFAKLAKIPESTISDWKKKGNTPSAEKLIDISTALGVPVTELLGVPPVESGDRFAISENCEEAELVETDTELLLQKTLAYKLRKLARLDRIRLDESEHVSKQSLHLFRYLDFLGMDKLAFIKMYLSHIQPFMITEMKFQEKFENAICVLDRFYRISVYIKVDATQNEEVIVSFHENHKNGVAKRNPVIRKNRYVYVFADSIGSYIPTMDSYTINLLIARGVSTFPVNVPAKKYDEDGFLVNETYIQNAFVDVANQYLEDLYTADLDFSGVEQFSSLQRLSYTARGNDCFSNISLLVDSILVQRDAHSRQVADAVLCIYCNSLELLESDKRELLETLQERFSVNSVRVMPELLERVERNLL
ncbi:MAG: helix-turn-helix transcriptional regulator [Lachnospiraceae bacterium]|nr:helix-turn-helix transcriptional regulator [Lachnospiraceae bacterium]MBQ5385421.1 helix-turn-helix transcriptional regulator [Lachnospiraceae bacterium]